ncbi:MAG TPA: helix-turn-helix transcriptional regulator [Povalibacter sp.]|uniref:helix-turn-helix transcriptional regulator n=1 Tax=Povalibacter sp. TaxID=1962978 RepID=UPI002C537B9C|nr:helix-turn-helix transcriptional regulator [Povalibacter sp.]HMN47108.1 helix-turn-helix transcriptional regulator [Povalibacter sp.]
MPLLRHRPAPPLDALIDCFWYSRGHAPLRQRERALPSGRADLVFNLHEDCIRTFMSATDRVGLVTHGAVVHGPQSRYFVLDARKDIHVVGVHFLPGGGGILGVPMDALRDRHVPLEDLWGEHANRLRDRLVEARDAHAMFAILDSEFRRRVERRTLVHPAISFALRRFGADVAPLRVDPVRRDTGYSERRFATLFSGAVGLTPKRYVRVQRLTRVVQNLASGQRDLAGIAADAGYYDQAHLTHDFRELAGTSPGSYAPMPGRSALHEAIDSGELQSDR